MLFLVVSARQVEHKVVIIQRVENLKLVSRIQGVPCRCGKEMEQYNSIYFNVQSFLLQIPMAYPAYVLSFIIEIETTNLGNLNLFLAPKETWKNV